LGPYAFDAIEKILAGESVEKWTVVNDTLFEQAEAAAVIDSRQY
jgi:hypothetical protein